MLDYIASAVFFAVLLLAVLWTRSNISAAMIQNQMYVTAQTNAVGLARQIEYDLLKIGFRVPGQKIVSADESSIRFYSELERDGVTHDVSYTVGTTAQMSFTENTKDFPLVRTVDGAAVQQNLGLTQFVLSYFDSSYNRIPTPISTATALGLIRAIDVKLRVEAPSPAISLHDTAWATVSWEKMLTPRNLGALTY